MTTLLQDFYDHGRALRRPEIDFLLAKDIGPLALMGDAKPWDGHPVLVADVVFDDAPQRAVGGDRASANKRFAFKDEMPDGEASSAMIIVARDRTGEPADIIAVQLAPVRVAVLHGRVCALGEHWLADPWWRPVEVAQSVGDWLRNGRAGVVILDSARFARMVLRDNIDLVARDEAQRRALKTALTIAPQVHLMKLREAA